MLPEKLDCFCFLCLRQSKLCCQSLDWFSLSSSCTNVAKNSGLKLFSYVFVKENKNQSRETGNIGYTRRRQSCQFLWIVFVFIGSSSKTKLPKTIQRNWLHRCTQDQDKELFLFPLKLRQHSVYLCCQTKKTKKIQRNWQHRIHRTKTKFLFSLSRESCVSYVASLCNLCCQDELTKFSKTSREPGNIGYTGRRQRKQKQSRETGNIWYTDSENKNNPEKLAT